MILKDLLRMMTTTRTTFFILFFISFWALALSTDAQNVDTRLRLSTKIQKELNDDLNLGFEYQHRLDQNLSTFDKAFIEPSISYDVFDGIRVGALYRAILDQNSTRRQQFKQRVAGYVRYSQEIDDFEIKLKTALQYGFDDLANPSFSYDQKLINRNLIELEYNWFGSKFTPFVSYEIFYHINHPNGGILNQWRLKSGTSYKLSKQSRIQLYYLFEHEFNVENPGDANIFGFGYSYRF